MKSTLQVVRASPTGVDPCVGAKHVIVREDVVIPELRDGIA